MENTRRHRSYRRTATTRRDKNHQKTSSDSFKEKVLIQCIISGVIFLIVLVINLVNTDFTNNLKQSLKSAIVLDANIEDLKASSRYFTLVEETVKTIFGYETETETLPEEVSVQTQSEQKPDETEISNSDFRIDEDILKMMNETPKKP